MPKIGCSAKALRVWLRRAGRDAGERSGLTTDERERLKTLDRDRELDVAAAMSRTSPTR
ncbi:MAG TPA: hypothetical protein VEB19_04085 [Gemmatimonadaceae bacterium]|nr:hypothetical protein [Gemmatimonadaceae bacterium]